MSADRAKPNRPRSDPAATEAISVDAVEAEQTSKAVEAEQTPAKPSATQQRAGDRRMTSLRDSVRKLRVRRIKLPMERWLMVLGGALIVAGLAAIILGWYGAAHTPYGFEQFPYLISGGLLGMALTILGGLFYFAFWLTKQIQESRQQADRTTQALAGIAELLAGGSNGSRVAAGNGGGGSAKGQFVATATGTMIHRPECTVVAGRGGLRRVSPDEPGLEPCKLCDPFGTD
ncbi:MAG TPA: hypothetical protein VKA30_03580 [Actinomycetota bacterium]|nr:hypothetical protein [Actinomycetota bacterium]